MHHGVQIKPNVPTLHWLYRVWVNEAGATIKHARISALFSKADAGAPQTCCPGSTLATPAKSPPETADVTDEDGAHGEGVPETLKAENGRRRQHGKNMQGAATGSVP